MKRARENSSAAASSSSNKSSKRTKSVQACANCRKHKTRCELLDALDQQTIRCHRCKVLQVQCSYQDMDRSIFEAARPREDTTNSALEATAKVWGTHNPDSLQALGPGYSGTPTPANAPGASNASLPNDLYPNTPHLIWDFFRLPSGTLDWTAPLEAMQELAKQTLGSPQDQLPTPAPPSVPNDSLENVLTPDQVTHLLAIFDQNYLPWLNFTPIRDIHNPLLDLVCCTIASRHLDDSIRSVVAPRLQALTADSVAKIIFQSRRSETLESIQCLLILSLWAPVCGADEDFRDGRLLVASAVSMALNMRLNDACQQALTLRSKRASGEEVDDHTLFEAMNKTRLWIALTNAESLLCIGSGRNPLSKRSPSYLKIFPLSPHLPEDVHSGRDLRLRLLAEMFDITEAGLAIRLHSLSSVDVDAWYDAFWHVLNNLNRVARILLPLAVVADFDVFYFKTLNIIVRTCRLLVLYQAQLTARGYFVRSGIDNPFWFRELRPHGINALIIWGKEALSVSESIIVCLLELDTRLLGTTPDYIFNMVAFACSYIIGVKFLVIHGIGIDLPGSSDKLLAKSITKLSQSSFSPDSAAMKCAALVSGMVGLWEDKMTVLKEGGDGGSLPLPCTPLHRFNGASLGRAAFRERNLKGDNPGGLGSDGENVMPPTPASASTSSHHSSPQSTYSQPPKTPEIPFAAQRAQPHVVTASGSGSGNPQDYGDMSWLHPELFQDAAFWSDLFTDTSVFLSSSSSSSSPAYGFSTSSSPSASGGMAYGSHTGGAVGAGGGAGAYPLQHSHSHPHSQQHQQHAPEMSSMYNPHSHPHPQLHRTHLPQ